MPKLMKKSYMFRTDGWTNPNYRKDSLLENINCILVELVKDSSQQNPSKCKHAAKLFLRHVYIT